MKKLEELALKQICSVVFAVALISGLNAQVIELSIGANDTKYFDRTEMTPHSYAEYKSAQGFSIEATISDRMTNDSNTQLSLFHPQISILLDHYAGHVETQNGGQGSSTIHDFFAKRTTMGVGLYQVQSYFKEKLEIDLGAEISFKIGEVIEGTRSGWIIGMPYPTVDVESTDLAGEVVNIGLAGRVNYNVEFNDGWYLVPQYKFHLGLTKQFMSLSKPIKLRRHHFSIGLKRVLPVKGANNAE